MQGEPSNNFYVVIDGQYELVRRRRIIKNSNQKMDSTARRLIGPNNQAHEKVFSLQKKINYIDLKIGVANIG